MKTATIVIACAVTLLTGCSLSNPLMPEFFGQPSAQPSQPDPEPDVKELVRAGADTLFTTRPSAVAVSRPRRIAAQRFSACVKAVVPGAIDGVPRPATLLVMIDHAKLTERHRATAYDGCATETYEKVEAAP